MKIAFCHHLSMGYNAGGEQEIAQVARELAERGHDVRIYAMPLTFGGRERVNPRALLGEIPYQERWFHRVDCDVTYITYSPFSLVSFRTRAPKVAGFHSGVWFRKPSFSYGTIPLLAKLAYDAIGYPELRRFDAIHVHDEYLRNTFESLRRPIFCVPHPIDLETFKPTEHKNGRFRVLYCGRPSWAKGFDTFLDLANEMKDDGIEFAWLGGDSRYSNVNTLGFALDPREVAAIMGDAHLLIEPQRINTIGRTALEAVAVGTTVLLRVERGVIPELPSIVFVESKSEMKRRITEYKRAWEEGSIRSNWRTNRNALDRYSVEKVANSYEEMFASLI